MSTMIQLGEVRRYKAGERVPWWCMFQWPCLKGWPRFGRITFVCDVEISLNRELCIHVRPVSDADSLILIKDAHYMVIGPPGRGAKVWLDPTLHAAMAFAA